MMYNYIYIMNIQKTSGLQALVAYGAPDIWLHGNPNCTIYKSSPYKRMTNSQFTFLYQDFIKTDNGCYKASILKNKRECDMIGKCYLSLQTKSNIDIDNIYNIIDNISISL